MKQILILLISLFILMPVFAEEKTQNGVNPPVNNEINQNNKEDKTKNNADDNKENKKEDKEEVKKPKNKVHGMVRTGGSEIIWEKYIQKLQDKVNSNFSPPLEGEARSTAILCKIASDGTLLAGGNVFVTKSSGSKEFDDAAIKAVKASAPFEKFPETTSKTSVVLHFILSNK